MIKEIPVDWEEKDFNPDDYEITQETRLDTVYKWIKKCGPSGLFYSQKNSTIYAHDACNFAKIKVDDLLEVVGHLI